MRYNQVILVVAAAIMLVITVAPGCKSGSSGSEGGGGGAALPTGVPGGLPDGSNAGGALPGGDILVGTPTPYYYDPNATATPTGTTSTTGTPTPVGTVVTTSDKHVMFVSSARYDGDLGGIAGADSKCQSLAANAGMTGTWRSVLSIKNQGVNSRVFVSLPVKNTKGELIASTRQELWRGAISAAVMYDEIGNRPATGPDSSDKNTIGDASDRAIALNLVWSGTTSSGDAESSDVSCKNWTSNGSAQKGSFGRFDVSGRDWIQRHTSFGGDAFRCNRKRHIYCISQ